MLPTPPLPLLLCCLPRVYARWSIANLPETQALLNYFQGKGQVHTRSHIP